MSNRASTTPRLLTERMAAALGFDRVATALGAPGAGPYLVPIAGWLLDFVLLSGASYVVFDRDQFMSPFAPMILIGLVVALRLGFWLRDSYASAVEELPGDELDPKSLRSMITGRALVVMFLCFYVGNLVHLYFSPVEVAEFVAIHGEAVAYAKYVFVGLFYFTVFADLATLILTSLLVLPWKIYRSGLTLDFSDVRGFAGLYGVSRLLQSAAAVYFLALTVWTAYIVVPYFVTGENPITDVERALFPIYWGAGAVAYVAPVYLLHRHITARKEAKIAAIDREIRDLDPTGDGRGLADLEPDQEDRLSLQTKYVRLQQIRSTHEYPANVVIVQELAFAALLPVGLQLLATAVPLPT